MSHYEGPLPETLEDLAELTGKYLSYSFGPQWVDLPESMLILDMARSLILQLSLLAAFLGIKFPNTDVSYAKWLTWRFPKAVLKMHFNDDFAKTSDESSDMLIACDLQDLQGEELVFGSFSRYPVGQSLQDSLFNWMETSGDDMRKSETDPRYRISRPTGGGITLPLEDALDLIHRRDFDGLAGLSDGCGKWFHHMQHNLRMAGRAIGRDLTDCRVSLPPEAFELGEPSGGPIAVEWGLRTYSPRIEVAFTEHHDHWSGHVEIVTRGPAEEPGRVAGIFIYYRVRRPAEGTLWEMIRDALSDDG